MKKPKFYLPLFGTAMLMSVFFVACDKTEVNPSSQNQTEQLENDSITYDKANFPDFDIENASSYKDPDFIIAFEEGYDSTVMDYYVLTRYTDSTGTTDYVHHAIVNDSTATIVTFDDHENRIFTTTLNAILEDITITPDDPQSAPPWIMELIECMNNPPFNWEFTLGEACFGSPLEFYIDLSICIERL
ncbi:MAG: hypothetical protein QNK23_07945 [Crocinitomicaceae bacterium]|nr:hypothetical protein [Crocinitomicaceae bacterium]